MKNIIANTNNNLMLAVLLHEHDSEQPVDVTFVPVVGWELEKLRDDLPTRLTPLAVGSDNDEGLKVVYNQTTEDWYVCNSQQQGSGKSDLIKLFNIHKEIKI